MTAIDKGKVVYVVGAAVTCGNVTDIVAGSCGESWTIAGIYATKEAAEENCADEYHWVVPVPFGAPLPSHRGAHLPGFYFPAASSAGGAR